MPAKRRSWTALEVRRACSALAAGRPLEDVARDLGRTPRSVHNACWRQRTRLGQVRPYHRLADYADRVRRLHAAGHSDREIARQLQLWTWTVRLWRKALGLPPQRRRPPPGSAADHSRCRSRVAALCLGWPGYRAFEARVLRQLYVLQPASNQELRHALGLSPSACRQALWHLRRLGAIRKAGWRHDGERRQALWELCPGVEPCESERPRLDAMRREHRGQCEQAEKTRRVGGTSQPGRKPGIGHPWRRGMAKG